MVSQGTWRLQNVGVHRLEVAAHGGGRVAVAEHPLDVEQVEVMCTIGGCRPVQNSGAGAAQVVGGDVA